MPINSPMSPEEHNNCVKQAAKKNSPVYYSPQQITVKIKHDYQFICSEDQVRQALKSMIGTTGTSNRWEIPTIVDPILYRSHGSGHKWNQVLIEPIYTRLNSRNKEHQDLSKATAQAYWNIS